METVLVLGEDSTEGTLWNPGAGRDIRKINTTEKSVNLENLSSVPGVFIKLLLFLSVRMEGYLLKTGFVSS